MKTIAAVHPTNLMVPLPVDVERLWNNLFCFDLDSLSSCMPFLALGDDFFLGQFVGIGRGPRTKTVKMMQVLKAEISRLSLAELWATLLLVMKTDCLDAQTPIGSFLVVLEKCVLDVLADRLMKQGLVDTRKVRIAREMIVSQLGFLTEGYRSSCEVFSHPPMLLENCCGTCELSDEERTRIVIASI